LFGIGRSGQRGVVAVGVKTKHYLRAGRFFQPQPLRADGYTAKRGENGALYWAAFHNAAHASRSFWTQEPYREHLSREWQIHRVW
jgi:hypothetical protein